jgi:hypothetical protein
MGDVPGMVGMSSTEQSGSTVQSNMALFRPSVDVFVADGVSVGGSASVLYMHFETFTRRLPTSSGGMAYLSSESRAFNVGLEPRVGTLVRLTEGLSFWPRVGVGYHAYWWEGWGADGVRTNVFTAFARPGLVAELGRLAYLDVGPEVRMSNSWLNPQSGMTRKEVLLSASVSAAIGLAF